MSLLLRLKPWPLKQIRPSLIAPFSTSGRLFAPKTRDEKLSVLESGEAIHSKVAKTNARKLFLSQFSGDEAAGRQKYTALSDDEKRDYRAEAAEENQNREDRKAALTPNERKLLNQFTQAKKEGTLKMKRLEALATDMPRKITNPYALFVKENFSKTKKVDAAGERGIGNVSRVLAQEWSNLSDTQKQHYVDSCVEFGKQYEDEYSNWVKTLSADDRMLFRSKGKKYLTKPQRGALLNAPKKPYQAFLKDEMASINWDASTDRRRTFGDTIREASRKWNALSQEQRQKYIPVQ